MKTGCEYCDNARAYAFGRIAGFASREKTPPQHYDEEARQKWLDGYEREERRKMGASHRPQS